MVVTEPPRSHLSGFFDFSESRESKLGAKGDCLASMFQNIVYFPLLEEKESLSLLEICFCTFSRGLRQMEVKGDFAVTNKGSYRCSPQNPGLFKVVSQLLRFAGDTFLHLYHGV